MGGCTRRKHSRCLSSAWEPTLASARRTKQLARAMPDLSAGWPRDPHTHTSIHAPVSPTPGRNAPAKDVDLRGRETRPKTPGNGWRAAADEQRPAGKHATGMSLSVLSQGGVRCSGPPRGVSDKRCCGQERVCLWNHRHGRTSGKMCVIIGTVAKGVCLSAPSDRACDYRYRRNGV